MKSTFKNILNSFLPMLNDLKSFNFLKIRLFNPIFFQTGSACGIGVLCSFVAAISIISENRFNQ